jgi:hypothetical protein
MSRICIHRHSKRSQVVSFRPTDASIRVPQLWLLRSGDLKDLTVIHYEKEAKP